MHCFLYPLSKLGRVKILVVHQLLNCAVSSTGNCLSCLFLLVNPSIFFQTLLKCSLPWAVISDSNCPMSLLSHLLCCHPKSHMPSWQPSPFCTMAMHVESLSLSRSVPSFIYPLPRMEPGTESVCRKCFLETSNHLASWTSAKETRYCYSEREWVEKAFRRRRCQGPKQNRRWHCMTLREESERPKTTYRAVILLRMLMGLWSDISWVILKRHSSLWQMGIQNFWKCQIHFRKMSIKKSLLFLFGAWQLQLRLSGKGQDAEEWDIFSNRTLIRWIECHHVTSYCTFGQWSTKEWTQGNKETKLSPRPWSDAS